ncbi:hypothetical protein [Streptomyces europaeiscabiei]
MELIEPGGQVPTQWRPEPGQAADEDDKTAPYAGVARK